MFATGYATVALSFEVFYRLTRDLPGLHSRGPGYLFYAFHQLVPRQNIQELAKKYYTGNMITPTFLGEFYADFGVLGVIVGPFIVGCIFGLVYFRAMRYNSIYWLCVLAMWVEIATVLPYWNAFSYQFTWLWDMFVMAWLVKLTKAGSSSSLPIVVRRNGVR